MLSSNNVYEEINSYAEVENYLLKVPKFAKKNTVEDTGCFLAVLGNPGSQKKIIHVAGTNGKGSVCAYLCSILKEAGYKVGMFSSPHLEYMRERFRIDGVPVAEEIFTEAFNSIMKNLCVMREVCGHLQYHPTFFELLFLMGMGIFENENVDYIILETGLGGRLDATNSVKNPILSVITEIGMDHMEYLGSTITEIAGEKAGILKSGVPVVFCDKRKEASEVISERAKILGIQAFPVNKEDYFNVNLRNKNIDFSLHSRYYGCIRLTASTKALYQAENAALAVKCVEIIEKGKITADQIAEGVRKTVWEGRMEEVMPNVFVDGAHNEDGIRAFMETAEAGLGVGKNYLLFSAVADKDYESMIRILGRTPIFQDIAVAKLNSERTVDLGALQPMFRKYMNKDCICFNKTEEALLYLLGRKTKNDCIYIVGSLYLVGEIKAFLRRRTDD